jgi:hypothetical protein
MEAGVTVGTWTVLSVLTSTDAAELELSAEVVVISSFAAAFEMEAVTE